VFDGTMRLAFCVDDLVHQVGVAVTQDGRGGARGDRRARARAGQVAQGAAQTARMLSLDVDAQGYEAVGARDPVVARVLATAPGCGRRSSTRPTRRRRGACCRCGWYTPAGGRGAGSPSLRRTACRSRWRASRWRAFPTPEQLLAVTAFEGVPPVKIERLHGVARAALDGRLSAEEIRRADPDGGMARLREIPGIGPFSASLIVIRASGVCDVSAEQEPRLAAIVGGSTACRPGHRGRHAAHREAWRPFRTWVGVLLRAASSRVPQAA
jgi:DNA-3-methyladenine glycosylase II